MKIIIQSSASIEADWWLARPSETEYYVTTHDWICDVYSCTGNNWK